MRWGAPERRISKVVVMQEGASAISRRPFWTRKPRMFVEDRDLDPTEPRWKSLQMSASSSRPHRIDDLHSTLRRASKRPLVVRFATAAASS